MNIKALRQASADLFREQVELKRKGRAILDNPADEGRLSGQQDADLKAVEARLGAIDDQMVEVGAATARWERFKDEDMAQPILRRGNDQPAPGEVDGSAPFKTLGEQLQAVARVELNHDTISRERLEQVARYHQDKFRAAAGDMTIASPSDGGFVVQTDFSTEILRRMNDMGQILSRVRKVPVSANSNSVVFPYIDETSRVTGSRFGAVSGYWVAEQVAPTASAPKLGRLTMTLNGLGALGYATEELLQDAPALSALFTEAFAEELTWLEENSFFRGTGAGQPQGILNATALISIAKETGQAANTLLMENLSKMWARCYARSRRNATWFVNQDVEPQFDQLAKAIGTAGVEPNFVVYGPDGVLRIKGRPVEAIEYCSTLGTVGDIILADLSQYMMIEKGGIQQAQSMHVRFTTHEMAFRATLRVDGQAMWRSALTPANGTNTLSPYMALATRA